MSDTQALPVSTASVTPPEQGRADILALGFGTAATMWTVGYLTHIPGCSLPQPPVLMLLLAVLLGGGYLAGKLGPRGWIGGLYTGLTAGLVNLLILGSVVGKQLGSGGTSGAGTALLVSVLASGLLAAAAAALGRRSYDASRPALDWTHVFCRVAAAATLLLLFAGGLVTSHEAGLAVPDWPNTFGSNMFLFPLADMTGGVYYEHAHRLLGSLVGLTTLVLMIQLLRGAWMLRVKALAVASFVLVCTQGLLGGLRVTGNLTTSMDPQQLAPSTPLAIVHGITGQLIFALLAALVVLTAPGFRRAAAALASATVDSERKLAGWVLGLISCQLVIGTLYRHKNDVLSHWMYLHILLAVGIVIAAVVAGLRASNFKNGTPGYARTGKSLLHTVGLQFGLGASALISIAALGQTSAAGVVFATFHQSVGAVLLATATGLWLWSSKLQEATAD